MFVEDEDEDGNPILLNKATGQIIYGTANPKTPPSRVWDVDSQSWVRTHGAGKHLS